MQDSQQKKTHQRCEPKKTHTKPHKSGKPARFVLPVLFLWVLGTSVVFFFSQAQRLDAKELMAVIVPRLGKNLMSQTLGW